MCECIFREAESNIYTYIIFLVNFINTLYLLITKYNKIYTKQKQVVVVYIFLYLYIIIHINGTILKVHL